MLIALADIGSEDRFDACIVGAGFAGIAVALTLARAGQRVLLLEGGDVETSDSSQSLYEGRVEGDPYFDLAAARLRQFGGSSGHWNGVCRTLDAADFRAKGSRQDVAWPIAKGDLDPHLAQASELLEIPPIPPDEEFGESGFVRIQFVSSPPVRAGEAFRNAIFESPRIFLALTATVTEIETNGEAVTGLRVVDPSGAVFTLARASRYVLATGGIENSRLLLWGNARTNGQLVKTAATLGTHWMEHPHYSVGEMIVDGRLLPGEERAMLSLSPTPSLMDEAGILNCALRVKLLPYGGARKIIADLACLAPEFGARALALLGQRLVCGANIRAAWEQEPREANRITLGDEVDALGVPKVVLTWRKSAADLRTVQTCCLRLGEHLARSGLGRVRLEPWVLGEGDYPADDELAGYHHMGGTRMSASPATGIVDAQCKVFGQENLYLAGSSVFPSCGHANPTVTIVQLALRLGEALAAR